MAPEVTKPGASGPSPAAQQAFDQALNAHDQGMLEKAESLYRQAVASDPSMTVAHNNLAMVLIDLNRFEEAIACLRRALGLNPGYAEAYNNLGFSCRKLGRDAEAADAYEQFLGLAPDVDDAPKIRAWITKTRTSLAPPAPGQPPADALAPPPDLPASEPAPGPPLNDVILDLGKTVTGLPSMSAESLPALTPQQDAVSPNEPASAETEPEQSAASQHLAQPPEDQPQNTEAMTGQAEAEAADFFGGSEGTSGEAEPAAAPSSEIPAEVQGLYTEAMTKFQDGALEESTKLCQTILDTCPGHFHTLILMGRAILGSGDFTRATTVFQKAVEGRPNDPEAFYFLGQSYEKRGLIEEAQSAYKRCLEAAPDGPRAKRLAKWLERSDGPRKVAGGAARCEFCLRAIPEQDLVLYDDRRCCKHCHDTLGGKSADSKHSISGTGDLPHLTAVVSGKRNRRGKVAILIVAILVVAAIGAWASGLHKQPTILRLLGLQPPAQTTPSLPVQPFKPPVPTKISPTEITFAPLADFHVRPMEPMSIAVEPRLVWPGGKANVPPNAEPLRLELVDKPEGMLLDDAAATLSWTPGATHSIDVPSKHKVRIRASAGSAKADLSFAIEIAFPVGRPHEIDMRLTEAYRASGLGLTSADIDGDGKPDLVAACGTPGAGLLSVALSSKAQGLEFQPRTLELPLPGAPIGLSAADVDGDSRPDIAWVDWVTGHPGLLRGTTDPALLRITHTGQTGPFADALIMADLDGDRRSEYVAISRPARQLLVLRSDGSTIASTTIPESATPLILAEIQAPGRTASWIALIASGGPKPGAAFLYELVVQQPSEPKLNIRTRVELPAGLITAAASGDFDGSGHPLVALVYAGDHAGIALLAPNEKGEISVRPAGQAGNLPIGVASADLNRDGRTDLLISHPESLSLMLSSGNRSFLLAANVNVPSLAGPVAIAVPTGQATTSMISALTIKGRVWLISVPTTSIPATEGGK